MGLAIFAGRFWVIIPVLAIAGSLVKKPMHPDQHGITSDAHTALRRVPGVHDSHCGSSDILPGMVSRSRCRTSRNDRSLT